ncbi:MAG TPA: hypothetical protein VNN06_06965 [Ramlibacter sp.]|nr:hypothetical protein [Ramlibacter sp.]
MLDASFALPLLWQSALVPFGAAVAGLAACRAVRLKEVAPAAAIAAGFVAACFAVLYAQWSLVPKVALDWLPWIALAGAGAAVAVENVRGAAVRLAARFVISLAAGALVVGPALASFGARKAALSVAVFAVLVWAVWSYMARAADHRPTPPVLLALVAGGAGLALMLDSSQSLGQLSGALASVLAACLAFNLPRLRTAFTPAAAGVAVLLLGTLLANAHLYAGFSLGYVALLLGGLLADPVVAGVNRLRRLDGKAGSWATAAALTAIPVAVTIGLAVKAAQDAGGY